MLSFSDGRVLTNEQKGIYIQGAPGTWAETLALGTPSIDGGVQ
jgi:hypothetical protein